MKIDRSIFSGLEALRVASPGPSRGARPGDRRSRARGGGMELADYRPYSPGDDLRLIDWNVFSRLDNVLVRLFHEDRDLNLVVVVDSSNSMSIGTPRKIDHAGELAACLAYLALKAHDRVRVAIAGPRGTSVRVKAEHPASLGLILDALTRSEPAGTVDLPASLAQEAAAGKAEVAVLLSDLLVEPEVRELTLKHLSGAGSRALLLHTLGHDDLDPQLDDDAIVVDSETGEEIPTRGKGARKAYLEGLARWRGEVEAACKERHVLYTPAFTTQPARELIRTHLQRQRVTESPRGVHA